MADLGDGWLPYPPTPEHYAEELATLPHTVTPALYATVCIDDDPERARDRLRTSIERYYNAPLEVIEKIQAMFAGTAEDTATWLGSYGADHLVVRLAVDDHHAALEEFAHQVLPLLRKENQ